MKKRQAPSTTGTTSSKRTKSAAATKRTPRVIDRQTAIEQRAYDIFLRRGAQHGADLDHWLEAEREVVREIT